MVVVVQYQKLEKENILSFIVCFKPHIIINTAKKSVEK